MTLWQSLYLTSETTPVSAEAVATALREAAVAIGYESYDPFGLIPGAAYAQSIKTFTAPVNGGWLRVIVEAAPPQSVLENLATDGRVVLALGLDNGTAQLAVYAEGAAATPAVLAPFLANETGLNDLEHLWTTPPLAELDPDSDADATAGTVPLEALPENVREMAKGLNPKQVDRMFNRMAGSVFRRGGGDAEDAADLLQAAKGADWNSDGGRQIRGVMNLLTVPGDWRNPTYVALRDAYSLHTRRQRKPDARLYPGDREAMDAVPNALDYIPIFVGKDD
jgi:hypothetical protein